MTLRDYLPQYREEQIYYKPNPGNGGDALIAAGAFITLRETNPSYKVITKQTELSELENKIIIYAGGGNLIPEYNNCARFIKKVKDVCKHLIILPHTVNGHFDLIRSLKERITIFCREEISYNNLMSQDLQAQVFLDHDLALILDPERFFKIKSGSLPNTLFYMNKVRKVYKLRSGKTLNAFRTDVEKSDLKLPFDNIDVSTKINHNYLMYPEEVVNRTVADIFKFLNKYEVINTNRLHIAIAGVLIGKTVNMYGNSYYKNRAIFEYSLKEKFDNINFIESNG